MFNSVAAWLVLLISRFFRILSPRSCRFYPSCSEYSMDAFKRLNFWTAAWLTGLRILKCHPGCPGGYDPLWKKEL